MNYFNDHLYGYVFFLFTDKKEIDKLVTLDCDDNDTACAFCRENFSSKIKGYKNINTLTGIYLAPSFFEGDIHRQYAVLAHECWHLTELCLFRIGVNINLNDTNEHLAYYMSFLMENYSKLIYGRVVDKVKKEIKQDKKHKKRIETIKESLKKSI